MANEPDENGLVETGMSISGQYTAEEIAVVQTKTKAIMLILKDCDGARPLQDIVGSVLASVVMMFDNPERALVGMMANVVRAIDEVQLRRAGYEADVERRPH